MYGCNLSKIDGSEEIVTIDEKIKLPNTFSYRKYLPKVLNQYDDPICIPCSISSYIDWNLNIKTGSKKSNGTDLWDIYNSKKDDREGMNFKDALEYLENNGTLLKNGTLFRVENYAKILSIIPLKMSIITNGPCFGVLPIYNNENVTDFWNQKYGEKLGYHAISIVGYTKEGFIIRNSWGRSYGKNGYSLFPLNEFNKFKEIWTIIN